jgi:hypothetical protein
VVANKCARILPPPPPDDPAQPGSRCHTLLSHT